MYGYLWHRVIRPDSYVVSHQIYGNDGRNDSNYLNGLNYLNGVALQISSFEKNA